MVQRKTFAGKCFKFLLMDLNEATNQQSRLLMLFTDRFSPKVLCTGASGTLTHAGTHLTVHPPVPSALSLSIRCFTAYKYSE